MNMVLALRLLMPPAATPIPHFQAAAAEAGAVEGVAPSATNNAALHALQELFANMKNMEVGSGGCFDLHGPAAPMCWRCDMQHRCELAHGVHAYAACGWLSPAPASPHLLPCLPQVAALREQLAQRHVNTQGTRQILHAKLTEELKKVGRGAGRVNFAAAGANWVVRPNGDGTMVCRCKCACQAWQGMPNLLCPCTDTIILA